MLLSRRSFLQTAATAAATAALGRAAARGAESRAAAERPLGKPLRILILGGTGYLGPATIEVALRRGHRVTMFNRGMTRPELFPAVARLQGDRDPRKGEGLKALAEGEWDVVIDNSAYYPRMVTASAALLAPRARRYLLISSISAYREPNPVDGDETAPLATLADPAVEEMGKEFQNYGGLKALCEKAAEAAMPGRVAVVRPGYIVGPDDPSGRFTYWPVRMDRGGEVAVPGGADDPVQIIDVRDLGAWLVRLAEDGATGVFNACGPERKLPWGRLVAACRQASPTPGTLTWVPASFVPRLEGEEFPIWAAATGDTKGFHTWSNARAIRAGLRFRPVEETAADTLAWYKGQEKVEKGRVRLAGPTAAAEAKLLAAWHATAEGK